MISTYPKNPAQTVMFYLLAFLLIRMVMAIIFWLGVGVESLSILLPIQVPIVEWYPWVAAVHLLGAMSSGERLFIWVSSMAGVILSYIALPLLVLELSIRHAAYRLEKRS